MGSNIFIHFCHKIWVRQGSVLSPFLFAIYLDDVPTTRSLTPRSFIVLYADDILLIAPHINELQSLFRNCEKELECLDMRINAKKSCCPGWRDFAHAQRAAWSLTQGHTLFCQITPF